MQEAIHKYIQMLYEWFVDSGMTDGAARLACNAGAVLSTAVVAVLANLLARRVLLVLVHRMADRTRAKLDDALVRRRLFRRLAPFAPALVIYAAGRAAFPYSEPLAALVGRVGVCYMILAGLLVVNALMSAAADVYGNFEVSRRKPIKGYVQLAKTVLGAIAVILIVAQLIDKSPWTFLKGLGALTAVLMLVFKDSILGFVASVRLAAEDMVRVGDWIEMPEHGADGDVIDVTLHTVKVQNWDKTITTFPTYALMYKSFKNWRGMADSGGRRIKRSVNIDMNTIRFCTEEMLARFERVQYIADYVRAKKEEIARHNAEHEVDDSTLVNGRHLTNIGTFRAYVSAYLRNHAQVNQEMTFLVRQLPPGECGLPIEVYVFCRDKVWANYEAIQADIFDHILAVIPEFDLRVFQSPSGRDFQTLTAPAGTAVR